MATKAVFRAEDLEGIQALTGRRYELIRGELYEVVTTLRHARILVRIGALLDAWLREHDLGDVFGDGGYVLERNPDTVRGPDISFVRHGRLTTDQMQKGYPEIAPDVAIEIRSANDTWAELERKANEFLAAGTELVVLVEPDEFVATHRAGVEPRRLGLEDVFDGGDVLPGFRCRVAEFFPN